LKACNITLFFDQNGKFSCYLARLPSYLLVANHSLGIIHKVSLEKVNIITFSVSMPGSSVTGTKVYKLPYQKIIMMYGIHCVKLFQRLSKPPKQAVKKLNTKLVANLPLLPAYNNNYSLQLKSLTNYSNKLSLNSDSLKLLRDIVLASNNQVSRRFLNYE